MAARSAAPLPDQATSATAARVTSSMATYRLNRSADRNSALSPAISSSHGGQKRVPASLPGGSAKLA